MWGDAGIEQAVPQIFTTYEIQEGMLNGRAHYLSADGKVAIAYCAMGKWMIQEAEKRQVVNDGQRVKLVPTLFR